jgi:cytochrome c peroxidase
MVGALGFILLLAGMAGAGCRGGAGGDGGKEGEAGDNLSTLSPLGSVPPDTTNAKANDAAAAVLGQKLFFERDYSGPLVVSSDLGDAAEAGRVSCASCHSSPMMSDKRGQKAPNVSLGTDFHPRNAPGLVNSSFYRWTNWGGRFSAQWELPLPVAESPIIMNSSRLRIAHVIFEQYRPEYEAVFGALEPAIGTDLTRFPASGKPKATSGPDGPWEAMTDADRRTVNRIFVNFGKAIAAYTRLLVSRNAPFDKFVAGDRNAISASARRGAELFAGKAGCISCHSGPHFSDDEFHNIGVPQRGNHVPVTDDGRFKDVPPLLASPFNSASVTHSDDPKEGARRLEGLTNPMPVGAMGQFRTPGIRGVTETAPYMHAGQLPTLESVIDFYDAGGGTPATGTKDPLMARLNLNAGEKMDLLRFLETLTGDPVPPALLQNTAN